MTTFTEVTNFTDFIEAILNKFFRFTRDIAQARLNELNELRFCGENKFQIKN